MAIARDIEDYVFTDPSGAKCKFSLDKNTYANLATILNMHLATEADDSILPVSIHALIQEGKAIKVSLGLSLTESGKVTGRKVIAVPSQSGWKRLVGQSIKKYNAKTKEYVTNYIQSVVVKTYVGYR